MIRNESSSGWCFGWTVRAIFSSWATQMGDAGATGGICSREPRAKAAVIISRDVHPGTEVFCSERRSSHYGKGNWE